MIIFHFIQNPVDKQDESMRISFWITAKAFFQAIPPTFHTWVTGS
jgi:hypothetical protein